MPQARVLLRVPVTLTELAAGSIVIVHPSLTGGQLSARCSAGAQEGAVGGQPLSLWGAHSGVRGQRADKPIAGSGAAGVGRQVLLLGRPF